MGACKPRDGGGDGEELEVGLDGGELKMAGLNRNIVVAGGVQGGRESLWLAMFR